MLGGVQRQKSEVGVMKKQVRGIKCQEKLKLKN